MEEHCQANTSRLREELYSYSLSRCARMGYPISAIYSRAVTLSECVNAWFEATGTKHNVVAARGGMLATKISEIVNGKNEDPQWSTVEKLAKGFELPLHVFIQGPPRPEKESGHGESQDRRQRNPFWDARLAALDDQVVAADSWQGDILKAQFALLDAQAALNRALRREDSDESHQPTAKAGR